MLKRIYLIVSLFAVFWVSAQSSEDGYWDNTRATNETVILGAGKKKWVKTADFPAGTTEIVYRISLLDDNQKISASLVSVLKAIPDPTGISQGSAGAVLLLSTISGSDKCKYAVFGAEKDAKQYETTGDTKNACVVQNTPVNKEAKLLSGSSKCLFNGITNLWFGFESDNWVMGQTIVLEVVPWVNYKLQRGWTNEAKKEVVEACKNLAVQSVVTNKEQFCGYFLDFVVKNYTYKDFKNMLPEERAKVFGDFSDKALQQSGEGNLISESIRSQAAQLFQSGSEQEAIDLLQSKLVAKGVANAGDYSVLGKYYLLTRQFDKGKQTMQTAGKMDTNALDIQLNLAHAYLLTDEFKKAKEIHKRYQNQNISAKVSWKAQTQKDFEQFKARGIESKDFQRILNIFE